MKFFYYIDYSSSMLKKLFFNLPPAFVLYTIILNKTKKEIANNFSSSFDVSLDDNVHINVQ
jgi:hypothetical protein